VEELTPSITGLQTQSLENLNIRRMKKNKKLKGNKRKELALKLIIVKAKLLFIASVSYTKLRDYTRVLQEYKNFVR
jgi:hypothetical protein